MTLDDRAVSGRSKARPRRARTAALAAVALALLAAAPPAAAAPPPESPLALCFAPGTPQEYVAKKTALYGQGRDALFQPASFYRFQLQNRWTTTALSGGGLTQGDPTILTWSYVPDGTFIGGFAGEPGSPSNLFAWLNGLYGGFDAWHALVVQVFERWGELTGNTYVYEPNDDGASFPSAAGVAGVRGDVRISGHFIDGNSGILAYNFFPNTGDMVLDSFDSFYNIMTDNSRRFRNVVAHEHGHGMGMRHVCPVNQTKLMEPFASTAFDGPQFDDVLGAQRFYGDPFEHNDTPGTGSGLGLFTAGDSALVDTVSVDDDADTNFYGLEVGSSHAASLALSPPGVAPYLQGPQNPNGSCSPGTLYDPSNHHDLGVEVLDSDGTTVLASANVNPAGGTETLTGVPLPSGPGTYFVRVFGDSSNDVQSYELSLDVDADTSCQDGRAEGSWNLPVSSTHGSMGGHLYFSNASFAYKISARLVETSPGKGTLEGTLYDGVTPDPDFRVVGDWKVTALPGTGVFEAKIVPAGSDTSVGLISGEFRDDPLGTVQGSFAARWQIYCP